MKFFLKRKEIISLAVILFLLIVLFLNLDLIKKAQQYLSEASGKPANIIIDTSVNLGPLPHPWQALAQGGEEKTRMLEPVIPQIRQLEPKYIRIDHIYDFYEVVKRENGKLKFNWERLDKIVDNILKTGATPFLSLSYMPPVIAKDGNITEPPTNWNDWAIVVRKTIEHFSGRNQRNLFNVHYEVWNEPDLFGNWKIGRDPDYCFLYHYAVLGAQQAKNVNPFKIGGPATTALYKTWVDGFLNYVAKNNLRLDFYSWHRYSLNPKDFLDDVNRIDSWLSHHGGYYLLPKFLTEWGSSSENSPYHDGRFDAAHLVSVSRQLLQRIDLAFVFEIKDGPSPEGKEYWGRWGLLTHNGEKKPKYYALELLNKIKGNWIRLTGEGTWVTGFAAKDENH
ncbi:unnamed protein product, partial [marine sediment metagenome]